MPKFRKVECTACPGSRGYFTERRYNHLRNSWEIYREGCLVCGGTGEVSRCSQCEGREDTCECPGLSERGVPTGLPELVYVHVNSGNHASGAIEGMVDA